MTEKKPTISTFLSDKPNIGSLPPSSLLSRLQDFLPKMEEANKGLQNSTPNAIEFMIENVESSSDEDSSDEEEIDGTVKKEEKMEESSKEMNNENRIEIDIDVFREPNSAVDTRDVSVQPVDNLPEAFRRDNSPKEAKTLIEEI